jgi:hypothetical protein
MISLPTVLCRLRPSQGLASSSLLSGNWRARAFPPMPTGTRRLFLFVLSLRNRVEQLRAGLVIQKSLHSSGVSQVRRALHPVAEKGFTA